MKTKYPAFVACALLAVGTDQLLGLLDASDRLRNFVAGTAVLVALVVAGQIIAHVDD